METENIIFLVKRLERDLKSSSKESSSTFFCGTLLARYKDIMNLVITALPEHQIFLSCVEHHQQFSEAISTLMEVETLLELSISANKKIAEGKIFASVEDKIKQAGLAFKNQDSPGVMNNLNTALELMLKEKLQIPTTITGVNTSNIIDILVSEKLGPVEHLSEVKKRLFLDAHTEHRGYIPQPHECVHALKSMEDLKKVLEPMKIILVEKVKNKIYSFTQKER